MCLSTESSRSKGRRRGDCSALTGKLEDIHGERNNDIFSPKPLNPVMIAHPELLNLMNVVVEGRSFEKFRNFQDAEVVVNCCCGGFWKYPSLTNQSIGLPYISFTVIFTPSGERLSLRSYTLALCPEKDFASE